MDLSTFLSAFSDGFMREDVRINNAKAAVAEERRKSQEQFLRDQLTYQKAIEVAKIGAESRIQAAEINKANTNAAKEQKEREQQQEVFSVARTFVGALDEGNTDNQIQALASGINIYGGTGAFTKKVLELPSAEVKSFVARVATVGMQKLIETNPPNLNNVDPNAIKVFLQDSTFNATSQQTTKIELNKPKNLDTGQQVVFGNVQSAWDANQANILNSAAKNNINDGGKVNIPTITSAVQRITDVFSQRLPTNKLSPRELEKQYLQDSSKNKQNAFGFLDSYVTSISSTFDSATTDFQRAGVANREIQKFYDNLFDFNFSTPENTRQFLTTLGLGNINLIKNNDIRDEYVARIYKTLKTKTRVKN